MWKYNVKTGPRIKKDFLDASTEDFSKNKSKSIDGSEITPSTFNMYNSSSWWVPVGSKELILFPSEVPHAVPVNETEKVRVSLAFNVFVRGQIGNKKELKWLDLP
jgi:hypothetical protein